MKTDDLTTQEQRYALVLMRAIAEDAGFTHISELIEAELERLAHPDEAEEAA